MKRIPSKVELRLADGTALSSWTSFKLRRRFDDAVESFTFEFAPVLSERERLFELTRKGEACTVHIDGAPQANCTITTRQRRLGEDGLTISVEARGLLHVASQASVDPYFAKSVQADAPLKNVLLDVLRPYGFTTIEVDAEADVTAMSGKSLSGRADPIALEELTQKDIASEGNETVLGFCRKLTTRYGIVLRTNHKGELLLCTPDYDQAAAYTLVEADAGAQRGDRMLFGIDERDTNEGMFSEVIVTGKTSGGAQGTKSSTLPVSGVYAPPDDTTTRTSGVPFANAALTELDPGRHTYRSPTQPHKPHYRVDKKSGDRVRCENTAKAIHARAASQAYQLTCSVDGLVSTSGQRIWTVDTVARIYCATFEIDEDMWLYEVEQSQDRRGGQLSKLTFIPLHSLELRL